MLPCSDCSARSAFSSRAAADQRFSVPSLPCFLSYVRSLFFFFFQAEDGIRDGTVTGVQTCALPIFGAARLGLRIRAIAVVIGLVVALVFADRFTTWAEDEMYADPVVFSQTTPYQRIDRKSTRLNSSHSSISYAVFCLKKKTKKTKKQ